MIPSSQEGITTNPHALEAIVKASETHHIVASKDIVDVKGVKLWGKGQPVSPELQKRLLERKLRSPIESCLETEDGATLFTLVAALEEILNSSSPIAEVIKPWATLLVAQAKQIPLHAVAQLLLTAAMTTRPSTLPHAVMGMALAGAMAANANSAIPEIRLAMLGGLLHDIGEVYIQPEYLDPSKALDIAGHKHMMVHSRVAEMLLNSTTDYPKTLTRGIGEHHERLDRSGYPARLSAEQISKLGRILMVMEVALGLVRCPHAPLTRISFALRVVPGEFDPAWTGFLCEAARLTEVAQEIDPSNFNTPEHLQALQRDLEQSKALTHSLQSSHASSSVQNIVREASIRLERLQVAWNALGLWGLPSDQLTPQEHLEVGLASSELNHRLRSFKRECLLLAQALSAQEKDQLSPLWEGLS